jgi:uncharacterized protein YgiB involved in biofilm formation
MLKKLLSLAFVASLSLGMIAGCEKSDEEKVDPAAKDAKEAVDNAADKAGDAAKDAADAAKDATE